jgi:hypothetical protein
MLAALRVAPPVRTLHPHATIRTRIRTTEGAVPSRARVICAELAQAAWDQLGYRSGGLVPHRTSPLSYCDCPGGPNDS